MTYNQNFILLEIFFFLNPVKLLFKPRQFCTDSQIEQCKTKLVPLLDDAVQRNGAANLMGKCIEFPILWHRSVLCKLSRVRCDLSSTCVGALAYSVHSVIYTVQRTHTGWNNNKCSLKKTITIERWLTYFFILPLFLRGFIHIPYN